MKKLIKLSEDHYVIVDDSRKSLLSKGGSGYYLGYDYKIYSISDISNKPVIGQITHSTQPLEDKFSSFIYRGYGNISLSEVEEAIYGYSLDKLSFDYHEQMVKFDKRKTGQFVGIPRQSKERNAQADGYIDGFKAHQELVKDKLFTLQDVINIIEEAQTTDESMNYPSIEEILKSFMPKTEWDIEIINRKIKLL